ncbi:hypothetical protein L0Y59_04365 [Candidatus Uhrbacteria bacterium]|nr:hypothetical protein [Candidatus Uhrbacteria bacterium]
MSRMALPAFSLVAASLVLFGWGCNPFQSAQEKIGEKLAEGMLERSTGADVDIDKGTVTVKDEETGRETTIGQGAELPKDFPDDVPMYPGAVLTGSGISRNEGVNAWAMMTTDDGTSEVAEWYADELEGKGWTSVSSMTVDGTEYRAWEKDEATVTATVVKDEESGATNVAVSYMEKS